MKKLILILLLGLFVSPLTSEAGTRVYIRIGPPTIKIIQVVKPNRVHRHSVWITGHWQYRSGRYIWCEGYWIKARPHHVYIQPHWQRTRHGYYFIPGYWVRAR